MKRRVVLYMVIMLASLPVALLFGCQQQALQVAAGRIAFESYRDGNTEIYVMNADGSNQTRLTNNPALDSGPAWSP